MNKTFAVACGYATECQVTYGLSLQRKLIGAVLVAAMSLVSTPAVKNARAAPHTTKLVVVARIATFFRMQVEHQAAELAITARDIERGYIEVPAASNFSVITNTQEGYVIDIRARSDVFRSVLVTGLQNPIEIAAEGRTAMHNIPHGRTTFYQLSAAGQLPVAAGDIGALSVATRERHAYAGQRRTSGRR